jgi:outer membrane lipoprotein-sorting protein
MAVIAGLLAAIAAGTAIAVAASGPGPVPKARSLASAIHNALGAKAVTGISANITFTNNLIGSTDFQGGASDPILQGASGRLWLTKDRLRLELQSSNGDAQIVVNKNTFWISDPAQHVVYEGTLPASKAGAKDKRQHAAAKHEGIPTIAQIQSDLNKLMQHVNVSGATPTDVAGQPAYSVRVSPKHDGGLLGAAQVAWDAVRGVPLKFAIYARGNSTPVIEIEATGISYGSVPASDFNVAPPAGSKVVKISTSALTSKVKHGKRAHRAHVSGAAAVAAHLPFKLAAPHTLIGLPRQSVELLGWGGKPAALVTYGKGLGGIAVIEQVAPAGQAKVTSSSGQGGPSGLSLPTVSINGASGTELDTPLGTVVRFTRGGVAYTVLGSVPATAADDAARGL